MAGAAREGKPVAAAAQAASPRTTRERLLWRNAFEWLGRSPENYQTP